MTVWGELMAAYAAFFVIAVAFALFADLRGWTNVCRPVPQADQARYGAAAQLYAQANGAITAGDFSAASGLLDKAIARLGKSYQTVLVTDDTAIMVQGGEAKHAHADFKLAARMKQSAVHARLAMFRRKAQVSARCHRILGWFGLG